MLGIIDNDQLLYLFSLNIKIKYVTQLPTHAPSFAFFANLPQYIRDPYRRYLENNLRREFDFSGVPVQIFFRKK